MRANGHAQLFARVVEPPAEIPERDVDVLPETLRAMWDVGLPLHPEVRVSWEPAVTAALENLAPEETAACVSFLRRARELDEAGAATSDRS